MLFPVTTLIVVAGLAGSCTSAAMTASDRAEAMLVGAFVADAATMPLHWIYDTNAIAKLVAGKKEVEFFSPPSCPFYNYSAGENTLYGQQTSVYLKLVGASGKIDPVALERSYSAYYTTGACREGCYLDGSTKGFLKNELDGKHWPQCGADDTQADAMPHAMIAVALLAGNPSMLESVGTIIRVTQNTAQAVAYGTTYARIMEKVVLNGTAGLQAVQETIEDMKDPGRCCKTLFDDELRKGLENYTSPVNLARKNLDVVKEIGQSCDFPFNLWSGAHLIAQGADYVNATTQTIMAGGDSASRNIYVNGFNAARQGMDVIPSDWTAKTSLFAEYASDAKALVSHRTE